jgi:hypothetical protein
MTTQHNPALAALRHHVTGAIERGEAQAIVEIKPSKREQQHTMRKVKISYRDTGGSYTANSEADCFTDTEKFAYRTALEHGQVITVGMFYAEPLTAGSTEAAIGGEIQP